MTADPIILEVRSQDLVWHASLLIKYIIVTNFGKNPRGPGHFWAEMTWNDPLSMLLYVYVDHSKHTKCHAVSARTV